MTRPRRVVLVIASVAAVAALATAWQGARAWTAWNRIDRIEFNLPAARESLEGTASQPNDPDASTQDSVPDYHAVLAIGSDERRDKEQQEGVYADAIMLYLVPDDGSSSIIVSLPRDLVVLDPCTGTETKLNRTLSACNESVSSEEHVALAVEGFTGITIDNFAIFRFEAFTKAIDGVGGIEICVPYALREGAEILPAGCTNADGATTLRWVRSRQTQEFVDGAWRFVQNVGDATRVERQQIVIFALLAKLKGMRSPADLAGVAERLGDAIVLDETLGLVEALAMIWDFRSLSATSIRILAVPTEPTVLPNGTFALRATTTFDTLLAP